MKEYKTNLMDITWNYRRLLLLLVLLAFDLIMNYTLAQNDLLPLWLNTAGALAAACVGGPGYGVVLTIAEIAVQLGLGGGLVVLVQGIATIAIVASFGTYVRLGFFGNIKGVILGILVICVISTCVRTPEYFALFGTYSSLNAVGIALLKFLAAIKLPLPLVSAITFFIIDLIDKGIILFAIYGILNCRPKTIAKLFDIEEPLPQCVIVKDSAEEEFLSEKEHLEEKAHQKLEKKKAEEALKNAAEADKEQK